MRSYTTGLLALLTIALATAAGGCGSQAKNASPTASIPGSDDAKPQTAASDPPDRLHPIVDIHTTLGDIILRLDAEHAPLTVDNFLTYVDQGNYDNTLFHQVATSPIAIILGGGYDSFQKERPTSFPIRNEAQNGLKNVRGTIAMARRPDTIDSSTSQFFINLTDNPSLDYKTSDAAGYGYCVFGEVIAGKEVVESIGQVAVHNTKQFASTPVEPVVIKWIHRRR